mmetsp:Transcript_38949/g.37281  ORF Transcript_38949/g.37281 Transcript_38949/m.37281 type:complete len:174 (-) Transcript_38949:32-553(-)
MQGLLTLIKSGALNANCQYFIFQQLGSSLKEIVETRKKYLTLSSVCHIGIQMLERLEAIHKLGFIHQDIKPDNILVGSNSRQDSQSNLLYLVDYGLSESYLTYKKIHRKKDKTSSFKGNLLFGSPNMFKKKVLSRRDDLISLVYMMLFLLDGKLPWSSLPQKVEGNNLKIIGH